MAIPQVPSQFAVIVAASTYDSLWFSGSTTEQQITSAIQQAATDGAQRVLVRGPYNASQVTFNANVQMVIEGGDWSVFDVKAYGAYGDGIQDDSAAIEAACAGAEAQRVLGKQVTLRFSRAVDYKTTRAITLPRVDIQMDTGVLYANTDDTAALTYGATGASNITTYRNIEIRVRRSTLSSGSSENSIGIKLINLNTCKVHIRQAEGFTVNVQAMADGQGFMYNHIYLGVLRNGVKDLQIITQNGGSANECTWYDGKFDSTSGARSGVNRYGVVFDSPVQNYQQNNHLFIKPNFELLTTGGAEAIPFLVNYGINIRCIQARDEANSATFARVLNTSTKCLFEIGYGEGVLDDQSTNPESVVRRLSQTKAQYENGPLVFQSGPLHKLATYADGGTAINVPTVHIGTAGDANVYRYLANFTLNTRYLETNARAVGVFVNTTQAKSFVISRDVVTGFGGRVYIAAYDEAGAQITTAGSVKGAAQQVLTYDSGSFGGSWGTGSDSEGDVYFQVTSAVKFVRVLCATGSAALRIRSFSIRAPGSQGAGSWLGDEVLESAGTQNVGSAAPTSGTHAQGRVVLDDTPSASGFMGWVCTTAGSPGTWKTFGPISA